MLSSVTVNSLGDMVSPCLTPFLILIFSLSLCRCTVTELSVYIYVCQDFYVQIFHSLYLQWCKYCLGLFVCFLGGFSSSFFSSLPVVVVIFENSLYMFYSKQIGLLVVLDVFSVPFLEKYHHNCFHPCFRDASLCTLCTAWLVVSQWFHLLVSVFQY